MDVLVLGAELGEVGAGDSVLTTVAEGEDVAGVGEGVGASVGAGVGDEEGASVAAGVGEGGDGASVVADPVTVTSEATLMASVVISLELIVLPVKSPNIVLTSLIRTSIWRNRSNEVHYN